MCPPLYLVATFGKEPPRVLGRVVENVQPRFVNECPHETGVVRDRFTLGIEPPDLCWAGRRMLDGVVLALLVDNEVVAQLRTCISRRLEATCHLHMLKGFVSPRIPTEALATSEHLEPRCWRNAFHDV